jgi:hypothetical protein
MRSNAADRPDSETIPYTRADVGVNQALSRMVRLNDDQIDPAELARLLASAAEIIERVGPELDRGRSLPRQAKSSFDALERNFQTGIGRLEVIAPEYFPDDTPKWGGASITQNGFDVDAHMSSPDNSLDRIVEAVAERIHAYTEIEDISAEYTITFAEGAISVKPNGDTLDVTFDVSTSEDALIRKIAPFLHRMFDAQDPDYDDDLYGLMLDL